MPINQVHERGTRNLTPILHRGENECYQLPQDEKIESPKKDPAGELILAAMRYATAQNVLKEQTAPPMELKQIKSCRIASELIIRSASGGVFREADNELRKLVRFPEFLAALHTCRNASAV